MTYIWRKFRRRHSRVTLKQYLQQCCCFFGLEVWLCSWYSRLHETIVFVLLFFKLFNVFRIAFPHFQSHFMMIISMFNQRTQQHFSNNYIDSFCVLYKYSPVFGFVSLHLYALFVCLLSLSLSLSPSSSFFCLSHASIRLLFYIHLSFVLSFPSSLLAFLR